MGWIGQTDLNFAGFDPGGLGPGSNRFSSTDERAILATGSLVIETIFTARARAPQRILRHERRAGWMRALAVALNAEGELSVELQQGDGAFRMRLRMPPPTTQACLRISYCWDAPGRVALLSVENLDQDLIFQTEAPAPLPVPLTDIREIVLNGPATRIGRDTRFVAFSDRVEPVGLALGILAGTPVETPAGPRLVERLRLGEMVQTLAGPARPVRWLARRQVPALGRFQPLRLRAPYFGLSRDILCAPDHRIVLSNPETEYQLGQSAVLVEAGHLADGKSVRPERPGEPVLTYYQVLLDGHECLKYAGLWAESLFIGSIGRSPELMATTVLAELPGTAIPRHRRFALPVVTGAQARALAHSLSA